ncbi:hypothetical protein CDAR_381981 [Caerostris darwini]|uniref:Uncharacterized protein n=1 Tax=Caerostris darwini TaxID=1538125 RepID=A0AAV4V5I8_9ARAC|nr:hypothetical protein CDAR_381981 [Caerostris darwini]
MLPALRLDKLNYAFSGLETSTSGAITQGREASLQLNSAVLFQVPIQELIRYSKQQKFRRKCNEFTEEYKIKITDPLKSDSIQCSALPAQIFLLLRDSGAKLTDPEIGDTNWKK